MNLAGPDWKQRDKLGTSGNGVNEMGRDAFVRPHSWALNLTTSVSDADDVSLSHLHFIVITYNLDLIHGLALRIQGT